MGGWMGGTADDSGWVTAACQGILEKSMLKLQPTVLAAAQPSRGAGRMWEHRIVLIFSRPAAALLLAGSGRGGGGGGGRHVHSKARAATHPKLYTNRTGKACSRAWGTGAHLT